MYVGSRCCFNRKALYRFDPVFSEDDDEDAPVHRSRWWRTVPLLDSEDTDELTEAGTSMEASNSHSFSVLTCSES